MPFWASLAKWARAAFPYLATFAWALVAFLLGQAVAFVALLLWSHGSLNDLRAAPFDGAAVTISVFVLNLVTVGVLLLAMRVRDVDPADYLGLIWPRLRSVVVGIIGISVIIALTDALLFVTGHEVVSAFQVESYTTAAAEGWLPLLLLATIIVGPAGEEIMFRGYLFSGFVRSDRSAWPAIVVISLLWAAPHLQYDLSGMSEIFVAGLFLGWMRWRSGSMLLTFLLHALFNLEATFETVLQVKHIF
jgi:uncharacterized protein